MTKRLAVAAAAAFAVGALASGGAVRADGSMSVLGTNAAGHCSEAAATAARGGRASVEAIESCDEAIKHVALSSEELAASYVNRGVLHLALSNYAAAVADDDAALQIQANLPDALVNRGAALAGQKRFADAIKDFDHALALSPRFPQRVYYNRGLAREDLGDLKGAYLDYLKASQLDPSWDRPKSELARFTVSKAAQG